jgi:hypothetical protein
MMDSMELPAYYADIRQKAHMLQEFTDEFLAVWQDSAARTIQNKALDPHQECVATMLQAMDGQCTTLLEIILKILAIEADKVEILRINALIENEQQYAQGELHQAASLYKQFSIHDQVARVHIAEVYQYIERAQNGIR